MNTNKLSDYCLFIDLDGVLVDFDAGVKNLFGKSAVDLPDKVMWPRLSRTPGFYADLPWMMDGRNLWDFVRAHSPTILTGLPIGGWAEPQKRDWCARELGAEVPVITCLSRHKHVKAREHAGDRIPVLVDDREKLCAAWEEMGGIFVLHTSAETSMDRLKELGF